MMKKLATLLCAASMMLAAPAVQAQWQWNWLLGFSVGWMNANGSLDLGLNDISEVLPGDRLTSVSHSIDRSGWDWGLLGGYQARCNGWVVGLELAFDWFGRSNDAAFPFIDANGYDWTSKASYHRRTNVGLTGRMGFQVASCLMPYVRVGLETNRDQLNFNGDGILITRTSPFYRDADINGSRRSWRGIFGFGVELPVPWVFGLSIRGEYDYHTHGRLISAYGNADIDTLISTKTKQNLNSVLVAFVWNFV